MKNFLLVLALIFVSVLGYSQGVPEKANTITITMPDSIGINDKVLKLLKSKDYPVKSTATTITAGPKTIKNNARVVYTFVIKGNEIILTGRISIAAQGSIIIENKGGKDSPILTGWQEMDKIAKALGGRVKYEIK